MHRLQRNRGFLSKLKKCNLSERKKLLNTISSDQLKCLCDVCSNLLRGAIPLPSKYSKKLKTHKNIIRLLAGKRISLAKKQNFIKKQQGGFLSVLLPILANLAGSILPGLFGNGR